MCIKGLVWSFVSRLSLWYWDRRFDRTLWSKRRDQYQSDNREANDKTKSFINKICDFLVFPFSTNIRYTVTLVVQELPSVHLFWCLRNRWSCVLCVKITWVSNRSGWFLTVNDVYRLLRYYWRMSRTCENVVHLHSKRDSIFNFHWIHEHQNYTLHTSVISLLRILVTGCAYIL